MYSPLIMGITHLVASLCLQEAEKDSSKAHLVSLAPVKIILLDGC